MDFKEVKIKRSGPIIHAITIGIFLFTLIGILFILPDLPEDEYLIPLLKDKFWVLIIIYIVEYFIVRWLFSSSRDNFISFTLDGAVKFGSIELPIQNIDLVIYGTFGKIISDKISDEIPDWIIKKCKDLLEMGSTSAFSTPALYSQSSSAVVTPLMAFVLPIERILIIATANDIYKLDAEYLSAKDVNRVLSLFRKHNVKTITKV